MELGDCRIIGGTVRQRDVPNFNILIAPLVKQLDAANLFGNLLGKHLVAGGALDFDFAFRHDVRLR